MCEIWRVKTTRKRLLSNPNSSKFCWNITAEVNSLDAMIKRGSLYGFNPSTWNWFGLKIVEKDKLTFTMDVDDLFLAAAIVFSAIALSLTSSLTSNRRMCSVRSRSGCLTLSISSVTDQSQFSQLPLEGICGKRRHLIGYHSMVIL